VLLSNQGAQLRGLRGVPISRSVTSLVGGFFPVQTAPPCHASEAITKKKEPVPTGNAIAKFTAHIKTLLISFATSPDFKEQCILLLSEWRAMYGPF